MISRDRAERRDFSALFLSDTDRMDLRLAVLSATGRSRRVTWLSSTILEMNSHDIRVGDQPGRDLLVMDHAPHRF